MSRSEGADAIAPRGFDNFTSAVLFKIKFNLSQTSSNTTVSQLIEAVSIFSADAKIETAILISAKLVPIQIAARLKASFSSLNPLVDLVIWGPGEINSVVEKYPGVADLISKKLFALRLENAVKKPAHDWKQEREERVGKLVELYRSGQFSLFCGAGISSSAGMPDWNNLLNSLFVTYLASKLGKEDDIDNAAIGELVSRLNTVNAPSALMAARYLRKGLISSTNEAADFLKSLRKSLYGLRDAKLAKNSTLISAIVTLCTPRRTGAKVRSVITYNFDDLLEQQLSINSVRYKCIYTQNEGYDADDLPVYHVHGFIPEDDSEYKNLTGSTLVFSEEGYHQIYADAYHWSNLVQLNTLRENTCLMVGLSMTDPNLRRLLDIAARNIEQNKHFSFMRRLTEEQFCFRKDKDSGEIIQAVSDVKSAREFLERHHLLNEELMKELGVTVIWFEDFDDIPKILKRISDS